MSLGLMPSARDLVLRALSIAGLLALPAELTRGVIEAAHADACAGDVAGARERLTWALARVSLPADSLSEIARMRDALDAAPAAQRAAEATPAFEAAVRAAMQDVERAEAARGDARPR